MTDQDILNEAERIKARKVLEDEVNLAAQSDPLLVAFPDDYAGIRIELDETVMGILRGYLLEKFDAENPPKLDRGAA